MRITNYKIIPKKCFFLQIFKVVYFAEKNTRILKNSIKFSIHLKKTEIRNTYIFTKCIDNFKFSISLKSYEE